MIIKYDHMFYKNGSENANIYSYIIVQEITWRSRS